MWRIVIKGFAAVLKGNVRITDVDVLRSLDGVRYEDERFTDYLGGPPPVENALAEALKPGGSLQFTYRHASDSLTATTEYRSRRELADDELKYLVDYTMGQWEDGIGENWTCLSESRCGYTIMCLSPGDAGVPDPYPTIDVIAHEGEG
jgi:hypothetical protein